MHTIFMLLTVVMAFPHVVFAECQEFKIIEYEDRVEAVCVGEPLTEAQKKVNLEEEKRQEAETNRKRVVEEQKRQRETSAANKAQAEADASERKKKNAQPQTPRQTPEKNIINPQKF
jgi:cobalamin-dependent methionine synthase I